MPNSNKPRLPPASSPNHLPRNPQAEHIRVRGLVQGVGFRPHVWHLAHSLSCRGDVRNDGDGVLIRLWAPDTATIDDFCQRLRTQPPPLARIDCIERHPQNTDQSAPAPHFEIIASAATEVHTSLVPDAATCPACLAELKDPGNRRYRYPFINCTHCGPRLSIVRAIPYDRANTSMAVFPLCPHCLTEYRDPADRRFHAQPNACPVCGPHVWLEDATGQRLDPVQLGAADAIAAASQQLAAGQILAIKGIGGFHLAADATNATTVARLRQRKARDAKPFALMARDHQVIRRFCRLSAQEQALLDSPAAPIVLLEVQPERLPASRIATGIAPGQSRLGFMRPYSPLHHLLLADWERPLLMTSGNRSDEPQVIDNQDARTRLAPLADAWLLHDRDILNRLDDSIVRVDAGQPRLLRRARGYAPAPLPVPPGFEDAPPVLAFGGELKNTFCLLDAPRLMLSQHLGDLSDPRTLREFERTLALYRRIFQHQPQAIAIDRHPEYHNRAIAHQLAATAGVPLIEVQHHFAHIAAVLGDNGWPKTAGPVLGVALDGLGYGQDGGLWGGEVLRADYSGFTRLAWLQPTPLPGGDQAAHEPWRNLLAQLHSRLGWSHACEQWPILKRLPALDTPASATLLRMLDAGLNAPLSSSTGRLFDAVAAALSIHPERVAYEGQAAMELEALASRWRRDSGAEVDSDSSTTFGYPFARQSLTAGITLDPSPMWQALLTDLSQGVERGCIAARFHHGLAQALTGLCVDLAQAQGLDTLALSGGSFQNRLLLESITVQVERAGLRVLSHHQIPSNDGGLALGQALIAAAEMDNSPAPVTN
ncbi:carbamoyltransferase HypF [Rhabdochromatium marinum]|uniref:carbamoyltransferase HypF n=1 Tax=Rhabdochromatium marinum TaxID=48729 RepID=UPI00190312CB